MAETSRKAVGYEEYFTQKTCKCGVKITCFYRNAVDAQGELAWPADHSLEVASQCHGFEWNGHFRSGSRWPNWAYCNHCSRRHDLTKFKAVERGV